MLSAVRHIKRRRPATCLPHHVIYATPSPRQASTGDAYSDATCSSNQHLIQRLSGNAGHQRLRLRSNVSVIEFRSVVGRAPAQHQTEVAHREHGGTGTQGPFIVLSVAPSAAMPGVDTIHHPAFLRWRETFEPCWTNLHSNPPISNKGDVLPFRRGVHGAYEDMCDRHRSCRDVEDLAHQSAGVGSAPPCHHPDPPL